MERELKIKIRLFAFRQEMLSRELVPPNVANGANSKYDAFECERLF